MERSIGLDFEDSTFRFLVEGAFLVVAVAVPFFVLAGAGRFLGFAGSAIEASVEGTGTEESRRGEWVCSGFAGVNGFKLCVSRPEACTGDEASGVPNASSLIIAGEDSTSCAPVDMLDVLVCSCAGSGCFELDDGGLWCSF
jgi:hypothetical protein